MDTSDFTIPQKRCSRKENCVHPESRDGWLPATEKYFGIRTESKDGFRGYCKKCDSAKATSWGANNRERKNENSRRSYHNNLDREHEKSRLKHQKDPEKHNNRSRRWANKYPDRQRARTQRWTQNNPDKHRKRVQAWRKNNPEKSRLIKQSRRARERHLPNTLTIEQWQNALIYFNDCCAVCGKPQGLWHTLAMDHWIPLNSPECVGTVPENIIPLCHGQNGCNNSKADNDAVEWLVSRFGNRRAREILIRINTYFEWVKSQG